MRSAWTSPPCSAAWPTGCRLTAFGQVVRAQAEQVEQAVRAFERQATSAREGAGGVVRVTCPEPIVLPRQSSGLIDHFHDRHPGVRVEFVTSDRYLDLMKGEADIALRSGDTDASELVGRKIADSLWAVYGNREYLDRRGWPAGLEDLARHAWVGFDERLSHHRAALWLQRVAPRARMAARNDSVLGLVQSARAGLGLAALPLPLGDAEASLERVLGPIDELTRLWRVLAPPQRRHEPQVAAFFDFVVEQVEALRPILTG